MQVQIFIDGDFYGTIELTKEVPTPIRRMTINGAPDDRNATKEVIAELSAQATKWVDDNIK